MRRVSALWTRLAEDIQKSGSSAVQTRRPRDLAKARINAVRVGDVLRDRLQITDGADEDQAG